MKYFILGFIFISSFTSCKKKQTYRCYNFNDNTKEEFNSQTIKFVDDAEMYAWRTNKDYVDTGGVHISIYCTRDYNK